MASVPATTALSRLVDAIHRGDISSIVCVLGAGASVAAGIPDFRSPGTGLYARLEEFNLPFAEAVFELGYFTKRPEAFFRLARGLWPGHFAPTRAHHFLRLLADKQVLRRIYTQNIDCLERSAGVSPSLLVEAHGSFASATCRACAARYDQAWLAAALGLPLPGSAGRGAGGAPCSLPAGGGGDDAVVVPRCACGGVVKPDIVFFGEDLPPRFHALWKADVAAADCVLVMGTSLQVHPVAGLPVSPRLRARTPRVVVNREPLWGGPRSGFEHRRHAICVTPQPLGGAAGPSGGGGGGGGGGRSSTSPLGRFLPGVDVMLQGDADDGVTALVRALGWEPDLERCEAEWAAAAAAAAAACEGDDSGGAPAPCDVAAPHDAPAGAAPIGRDAPAAAVDASEASAAAPAAAALSNCQSGAAGATAAPLETAAADGPLLRALSALALT